MEVLPSTGASRYHNCCMDGGTSQEYFGYILVQTSDTGLALRPVTDFPRHQRNFIVRHSVGQRSVLQFFLENSSLELIISGLAFGNLSRNRRVVKVLRLLRQKRLSNVMLICRENYG
jgi:hypothetical protein